MPFKLIGRGCLHLLAHACQEGCGNALDVLRAGSNQKYYINPIVSWSPKWGEVKKTAQSLNRARLKNLKAYCFDIVTTQNDQPTYVTAQSMLQAVFMCFSP